MVQSERKRVEREREKELDNNLRVLQHKALSVLVVCLLEMQY